MNKLPRYLSPLLLVCLALLTLPASAQDEDKKKKDKPDWSKTYATAVDDILPGLSDENLEKRFAPQMALQALASKAGRPDAKDERRAFAKVLIGHLEKEDTPQPAKVWMTRQLEHVGRGESVAILSYLIGSEDRELKETARRALEENPAPAATSALLSAQADPADRTLAWRVGLIHSIGLRADPNSVPGLSNLLMDRNPAISKAAARALSRIPSPEAFQTLAMGYSQVGGPARAVFASSLLDAVPGLKDKGVPIPFNQMYGDILMDENLPTPTRVAAMNRLASEKPETIADAVRVQDPTLQSAAIRAAVKHPAVLESIGESFVDFAPAQQAAYLWAVADGGNAAGEAQALEVLDVESGESIDKDTGLAAVAALASIANANSVMRLLSLAAAGPKDFKSAATHALERMPGADAAKSIEAAAATGEFRVTALKAIAKRGTTGKLADLIDMGGDEDGGVANAAMEAVGKLGGDAEISPLVAVFRDGNNRALRPLREIVNRAEDRKAVTSKLLAGIDGAPDKIQGALLGAVAVAGDASGLSALQDAAGKDGTRGAAVRALGDWPGFGAMSTLLELAGNEDLPIADHVLSIRGAVGLFDKEQDRPDEAKRLELAKQLMDTCRRDDERKQVISVLGGLGKPAAEVLMPLLDDEAVRPEAAAAALALCDRMKKNKVSIGLAEKVASLNISKEMTKRANKVLEK